MNIIFLDIDGVLNSQKYLISSHKSVVDFYEQYGRNIKDIDLLLKRKMFDIDTSKVMILRDVIDRTGAKVVIISSWKKLEIYPYVVSNLIDMGISIVGSTCDNGSNRGFGIRKYCEENNIDNYVIIDDDVFDEYDIELLIGWLRLVFMMMELKMNTKKQL